MFHLRSRGVTPKLCGLEFALSCGVLGQLFFLACIAAMLSIAGILFVLFGPVPVKRTVTIVPRLPASGASPSMPSLVAQLAPEREQHFTPASAFPSTIQGAPPPYAAAPATHSAPTPPPLPIATTPAVTAAPRRPKGGKVQPLPKKRAAKGTESPSPFAPVVRSRNFREEEVATNPVPRVSHGFESDDFTMVDET